jgi:hypothetical protein
MLCLGEKIRFTAFWLADGKSSTRQHIENVKNGWWICCPSLWFVLGIHSRWSNFWTGPVIHRLFMIKVDRMSFLVNRSVHRDCIAVWRHHLVEKSPIKVIWENVNMLWSIFILFFVIGYLRKASHSVDQCRSRSRLIDLAPSIQLLSRCFYRSQTEYPSVLPAQ